MHWGAACAGRREEDTRSRGWRSVSLCVPIAAGVGAVFGALFLTAAVQSAGRQRREAGSGGGHGIDGQHQGQRPPDRSAGVGGRHTRHRDHFVRVLSHELRTPLNAILGWVGVLRHDASPATVSKAIEVIDRNSRRQWRLVDELLDASRVPMPLPDDGAAPSLAGASEEAIVSPLDGHVLDGIAALVVDDEPDARELVQRWLEDAGAGVTAVASANDGVAMLADVGIPDVIVSDITMPGEDGYRFMERVRRMEGCAAVPAAALTARGRAEDRTRAWRAGYQTHLVKPVEREELVALVASLTGRSSRSRSKP